VIRAGSVGPAVVAAGCLAVSGCSLFRGAPEEPKPLIYTLCLQPGPKLNWYEGTNNTLSVRVYQLTTPDSFLEADPARLVEPGATVNGAIGDPIEKTLYPDTPATIEIRQQPDATALGLVAFYYQATGRVKITRRLPQRGEAPPKTPPPCVVLGPNAIESPV
jgi:type VI secretion system VasD/TssJ family lipoprotein